MGFRLVPNSVTLNDLELRNRPNGCVISLNSVAFRTDCVKVFAAAEIYAKNVVFSDILLQYLQRSWRTSVLCIGGRM